MKLPGRVALPGEIFGPQPTPERVWLRVVSDAELLAWAKELAEAAWFRGVLYEVHRRDFGIEGEAFDDWWAGKLKEMEGK